MVGLIASARRLATSNVWLVGASAWFIVCVLWAAQKHLFPAAEFFLPPPHDAMRFFCAPTPDRIFRVLQAVLSHTVVMPDVQTFADSGQCQPGSSFRMLSVEQSWAGSGGVLGSIATLAWIALGALAARAAVRTACSGMQTLCLYCGAALLAFYGVYSYETFLITMLFLPLLIVLAAGVTFTRFRRIGLALATVVIVLGGANNWLQVKKAAAIAYEVDVVARGWTPR